MNKKKDTVTVRLLGGFSAMYNGSDLIDSSHSVSQYAQMMQLLLYYGKAGVSRGLMKEVLFGDRDIDDVQHEIVRKRIDKTFLSPSQRTGVDYQINTAIISPDQFAKM